MRFGALFCLWLGQILSSQAQFLPDSVIVRRSKESARLLHDKALEGNLHIYTGAEYSLYKPIKDEHPYYLTDDWTMGDILYDGEWFSTIPMVFELAKMRVIVYHNIKGTPLQLNSANIEEFIIQGHRFVNFKSNDSIKLKNGFYEVLHSAKTNLLCYHSKKYFEETVDKQLVKGFKEKNQYYLLFKNEYHQIDNKRSIIKILNNKKSELSAFIRQNNLYAENQEKFFIKVVAYYDSLSK